MPRDPAHPEHEFYPCNAREAQILEDLNKQDCLTYMWLRHAGAHVTGALKSLERLKEKGVALVDHWKHRDHLCDIEMDIEEDNAKAFHHVQTPDGRDLLAPISPYDNTRHTVNLWIEAGCPERKNPLRSSNFDRVELENIIARKRK